MDCSNASGACIALQLIKMGMRSSCGGYCACELDMNLMYKKLHLEAEIQACCVKVWISVLVSTILHADFKRQLQAPKFCGFAHILLRFFFKSVLH